MLDRVFELVGYGWRVIPLHSPIGQANALQCTCKSGNQCRSPAKHPRTPQGLRNASSSPEWIEAWWRKWPSANVGVTTGSCSGIVVLDIDPHHGGEDSLDRLFCQHGELPDTAESLTGGGGRHIFFQYTTAINNSAGRLGAGLDVRADGGYVVGPGSLHISGATYDWEASSSPNQVGIAPMPPWLLNLCIGPTYQRSAVAAAEGAVVEGGRNQWLTSVAGAMRRKGVAPKELARALWVINQGQCTPALDQQEVLSIAQSVARYPPEPRR